MTRTNRKRKAKSDALFNIERLSGDVSADDKHGNKDPDFVPEKPTTSAPARKRTKVTPKIGSRRQVWNGTRLKTSGNLYKADLYENAQGRICSVRQRKAWERNSKMVSQSRCLEKAHKLLQQKGFVKMLSSRNFYKGYGTKTERKMAHYMYEPLVM